MISLSIPHAEEFDKSESFNNSITDTVLTNDQLDDSKLDMNESVTFLEEIMPRTCNKYGK